MRVYRHINKWWYEPSIKKKRVPLPATLKHRNPRIFSVDAIPYRQSATGKFSPKRLWVPYNRLQPIDVGYIVPLYTLKDMQKRYGLTDQSIRYFRKYILPEPFDIVRRRSVASHHWSRFVLMVLDVVLADLEKRGYLNFHKSFEDHINLVNVGCSYLQDYYEKKYLDTEYDLPFDKLNVAWMD